MTDRHPYVSGGGTLVQVVTQFRSSFPGNVTAATLQKLGLAPKNESYILNILKFLGLIDDEGNRTKSASEIFSQHDDAEFSSRFSEVVKNGYKELFDLHGDGAWEIDRNALITFFRSTDHTTSLVGSRQANTFKVLAALAGHGEAPRPKATKSKSTSKAPKPKSAKPTMASKPISQKKEEVGTKPSSSRQEHEFGLTVRIEINLPSDADQETYDKIFKSIRGNLLNG